MLEAPLGFLPRATGFYFSPQIDYGYFDGMMDVGGEDAVRRKVSELARHPGRDLLLPPDFEGGCQVDEQMRKKVIGYLLLAPYTAAAVNRQSILKPLCDYVEAHYVVTSPATPQSFNYELRSPKSVEEQ